MDKMLLSLNEVCELTGWGKTKTRQVLNGNNNYTVRFGNRIYVIKDKFLAHIEKCARSHIDIG